MKDFPTGVPHSAKHTKPFNANAKARTTSGGHHYSGGPKTESHHMGEKKLSTDPGAPSESKIKVVRHRGRATQGNSRR